MYELPEAGGHSFPQRKLNDSSPLRRPRVRPPEILYLYGVPRTLSSLIFSYGNSYEHLSARPRREPGAASQYNEWEHGRTECDVPKARWRPGHVGHMIEINGLGERGAQKRGADVSESLMDWRRSGVLSWSSGAGWLTEESGQEDVLQYWPLSLDGQSERWRGGGMFPTFKLLPVTRAFARVLL